MGVKLCSLSVAAEQDGEPVPGLELDAAEEKALHYFDRGGTSTAQRRRDPLKFLFRSPSAFEAPLFSEEGNQEGEEELWKQGHI